MSDGGKGSTPRPIPDRKKYEDNWDRIFGKKKVRVSGVPYEVELDNYLLAKIDTPCVDICTMGSNGLCTGCGRTLDEITNWSYYDNGTKQNIMSSLNDRIDTVSTLNDRLFTKDIK
jgi:uncharacterized protein